jgi:hypothetical protein
MSLVLSLVLVPWLGAGSALGLACAGFANGFASSFFGEACAGFANGFASSFVGFSSITWLYDSPASSGTFASGFAYSLILATWFLTASLFLLILLGVAIATMSSFQSRIDNQS